MNTDFLRQSIEEFERLQAQAKESYLTMMRDAEELLSSQIQQSITQMNESSGSELIPLPVIQQTTEKSVSAPVVTDQVLEQLDKMAKTLVYLEAEVNKR